MPVAGRFPRILVAGLFHEAHSFSPLRTDRNCFVELRGEALLAKARSSASGLGGGVRRLIQDGAEPIPSLSAVAAPGGLIADDVYCAFRDEIVAAARATEPDGIFLDLHGAIASESIDDCEGELMAGLRQVVGPSVPIAACFDLHGNVTQRMMEAVNICIACKENPHSDYHLAGDRAAELLVRTLRGEIDPVCSAVWVPAVLRGKLETGSGPLRELHAIRARLNDEQRSVLDVSLFNCHSQLDAYPGGQCVTSVADGDPSAAAAAAEALARAVWERRAEFAPDLPSLDDILTEMRSGTLSARPVILGDYGDRVLAGTPGDGTFVLRTLSTRWPELRVLAPVTAPDAVAAAKIAGIGGVLVRSVGGAFSPHEERLLAEWRVGRLGDGNFVQRGPYLAGEPAVLGDCAVLHSGNLTVLATSRPGLTQDPEAFLSNGIDPADYDVVVVKSGFHFKLSFSGIGPCIAIGTPGMSNVEGGMFTFRKRQRMWPEVSDLEPELTAATFGRPR